MKVESSARILTKATVLTAKSGKRYAKAKAVIPFVKNGEIVEEQRVELLAFDGMASRFAAICNREGALVVFRGRALGSARVEIQHDGVLSTVFDIVVYDITPFVPELPGIESAMNMPQLPGIEEVEY